MHHHTETEHCEHHNQSHAEPSDHWIEMKSVLGASKALEYLIQMLPQNAHLIKDNLVKTIF